MSGGERARVLLARLLVTRATVLLADEPAAGLDPEAQILMLERLRARAQSGGAVVVTSHDLTTAARACDRIAVVADGRLVALGPAETSLTRQILAEVFALDGALIASDAGVTLAARRLAPKRPGG
jgi:iron complex transport system ATP-binding protein